MPSTMFFLTIERCLGQLWFDYYVVKGIFNGQQMAAMSLSGMRSYRIKTTWTLFNMATLWKFDCSRQLVIDRVRRVKPTTKIVTKKKR